MARKPVSESNPPEAVSYEEAVEQLDGILERIESGEIGLEDSITAYEQGVGLIKRCREILDRAEQRIEHLDAARLGPDSESSG